MACRLRCRRPNHGRVLPSARGLAAHARRPAMTYEYPLAWPVGFPRTKYQAQSRFDTAEERVKRNLELQLDLMDATKIVVTTNVELRRDGRPYAGQRISDPGVA